MGCCFDVMEMNIWGSAGALPLTLLRVLFREKHPETPKNLNRIRGKKYLHSALKGALFWIMEIEFRFDC